MYSFPSTGKRNHRSFSPKSKTTVTWLMALASAFSIMCQRLDIPIVSPLIGSLVSRFDLATRQAAQSQSLCPRVWKCHQPTNHC